MRTLLILWTVSAFAAGSSYRAIFPKTDQPTGLARYGELTVEPGGASEVAGYPAEEQIYFVLEGRGAVSHGGEKTPIRANDFLYIPAGLPHGVVNDSTARLRVMVMGFKLPDAGPAGKFMIANADDVTPVEVAGHGKTVLFKLLMGTTKSTRDQLAAARQMVSLFIMEFSPGGTNIPHRHANEEEIYLILRGSGDMVVGDDRIPSKTGDTYYIRPGTTVGFYSGAKDGQPKDLILAVRWKFPRP
jgi:mannose-6-phosphate isomerase-like protein (cupin superfamily)